MSSKAGPSSTTRRYSENSDQESAYSAPIYPSQSQPELEQQDSEPDSDVDIEAITPKTKSKSHGSKNYRLGSDIPPYSPPVGMTPLQVDTSFTDSAYEWDALARRPGVELWTIRVPQELKPSRLAGLSIRLPTSSSPLSGHLKHKTKSYTLSSAGKPSTSRVTITDEGGIPEGRTSMADVMIMSTEQLDVDRPVEGGEEMEAMRFLVPRLRDRGRLFVAPMPITRQLVLAPSGQNEGNIDTSTQPLPGLLSTTTELNGVHTSRPSKRSQPSHLMKFRNHAYGSNTDGPKSGEWVSLEGERLSHVLEKKKRKSEAVGKNSPQKKKTKI